MLKNKQNAPFYLILNEVSAKEMEHHCKHYVGRGLMKTYPSIEAFCKEAGVPSRALASTIAQYQQDAAANRASRGGATGGGLFSSFFGKKSDPKKNAAETNSNQGKTDRFGKTQFRNAEHFDMQKPVHVAIVAPVVHYTMGGVRVNEKTEVLDASGKPIKGLFCAGEAAGGVHGKNRLGGNSLLDCVVYGRVAGEAASSYLLQAHLGPFSNHRLNVIYQQLDLDSLPAVPPIPTADVPAPAATETTTTAATTTTTAPAEAAAAPPASAEGGASKKISRAEVAKHNKENDCWVIVHGQVLDLTKFLPDHPGGKQSIIMYAGKDCTKEFDIVHQVELIEKYTPESVIGVVSD
ncbi:flavoprotein subunit-like protein [Angomonas deanei]|uniref:FAD binding domain/Cytochrome b5-like Heme/Steroid binding domain containing protein, putative n=1 Tax=Angomonas deanei TaxID=59799 RepID=A0A7G2CUX9_9TRYP|nr:flavoprotein subunit-like protein [Angomonas deanei]CAD2222092.1 FAD binding domain/Cytochrome b5-like Heme/Steroid binding domain containing protein, putative [Angomonas deanei]|eukprot:EPY43336.1 flavoprotein subunit-like protein [Angomonas deanei]